MTTEKKVTTATKVIYWVTTALIALSALSGVFFINKPESTEKMHHLGLPMWFAYEVTIGSFIGGLILLIPMLKRVKEWAYVAFGITYISAFVAHITLDGFGADAVSAIVVFGILVTSYICYHKIND